ncbi:MAG: hypothetical protein Q8K75_01240 [Chlamydiales bacterium]|nr:hypothetical protein [Chlamydiales bacterium]
MRSIPLLLTLSMLCGCDVVQRMNMAVEGSIDAIERNIEIVECSTRAIAENQEMVQRASETIAENGSTVRASSEAIRDNLQTVKESTSAIRANDDAVTDSTRTIAGLDIDANTLSLFSLLVLLILCVPTLIGMFFLYRVEKGLNSILSHIQENLTKG